MDIPQDEQPRRIGGRYLLSAQLGAGAMGTVWSGYDELLQRAVAVKQLLVPPGIPEQEALDMRERMLREARALGGLSHPNVITVFDVVDAGGGEPMVVLEMVPSRDVASLITQQGVLSLAQAAVVGFATASALRAAHRAGITHRDVKPANVLVADDGRIKLSDFGIARNAADAPMTSAGLVLGSPAYIAPEVAAGQPVTPAADLWGLGATLFAAVEGRPPYDVGGDPVSTITEVVDGEVPRTRVVGPLAEVISSLMVKAPARRMSLDEVRIRLRPLIADPDDPLYPGSPDAPTMAAAWTPMPVGVRRAPGLGPGPALDVPAGPDPDPDPAPGRGAAALASDPGPLPAVPADATGARPAAPTGGRTVARAVALVLAGALTVLVGAAAGWTGTRTLAGQSPWTTDTLTSDTVELRDHVDPLGFSAAVPQGWTTVRGGPGTEAVTFLSPGRTEAYTAQRSPSVAAATGEELTPDRLGADVVAAEPVARVGPVAEVRYRTVEDGRTRTTWLRALPDGAGAWTVRLTVPGDRAAGPSARLFTVLADRFDAG